MTGQIDLVSTGHACVHARVQVCGRVERGQHTPAEGTEHGEVGLADDKAEQQVDQGGDALPSRSRLQGLHLCAPDVTQPLGRVHVQGHVHG